MCWWVLISLAPGAAAFGVAPASLSALEQQQVCPCAAALPVSIQSPSREVGAFWTWLVEVWKGSFLTDTPERAVEPGVVCGASQCWQVPLERQPGVKWEEDSAMLLCSGVQRESNDLPFLYT